MVVESMLYLGIACMLVPVFAEYAKIRKNAEKAFNWIAVAGVSFILSAAFGIALWTTYIPQLATYGAMVFQFVGWIFVLVGALLAITTMIKK